jgi:uncharacterized membrane protein
MRICNLQGRGFKSYSTENNYALENAMRSVCACARVCFSVVVVVVVIVVVVVLVVAVVVVVVVVI